MPVLPGHELTQALIEWMPEKAVLSIVPRLPETAAETGKIGLPLIAEAMVRGVSFANQGITEAKTSSALRDHLSMRDWIQGAIDLAYSETLFGEFLRHYAEALVRHSEPAVSKAIEDVPVATMISLYLSLSESGQSKPTQQSERMQALGSALGLGTRQLSLGMLHYGSELGLFPDRNWGLTPELKGQARRLGPGPMKDFELVDSGYFEMRQQFLGIRREIESDWGSIHPMVRGFGQKYENDPWVREQGVERIQQAVGEMEDYLTKPRH